MRWAALALALGLLLAGCTSEAPPVVRSSQTADTQASDDGPSAPNPEMATQKKTAGIADCPKSGTDAVVAKGLPDATVECLGGGRPVRLAGLRGKPMIINVWAQWCGPCRVEAPVFASIADSRSVQVLGVDLMDNRPDLAVVFAAEMRWTYPQLYDADRVFRTELQVPGLPVTFFVGADGVIKYRHPGPFLSADQLRETSKTYLGVTP